MKKKSKEEQLSDFMSSIAVDVLEAIFPASAADHSYAAVSACSHGPPWGAVSVCTYFCKVWQALAPHSSINGGCTLQARVSSLEMSVFICDTAGRGARSGGGS